MEKIKQLFLENKYFRICIYILFGTICWLLLSFRYQLVTSDGEFYRINQITGQVEMVKGTRFIKIDNIKDIKKLKICSLKTWEQRKIGKNKNIGVDVKTIWKNGRLFYSVCISPFSEVKKYSDSYFGNYGIDLIFCDENGFTIKTIPIKFNKMIRDVSAKELYLSESIELSYEEMKEIQDLDISWNFE